MLSYGIISPSCQNTTMQIGVGIGIMGVRSGSCRVPRLICLLSVLDAFT